jgi:hypothetical protein
LFDARPALERSRRDIMTRAAGIAGAFVAALALAIPPLTDGAQAQAVTITQTNALLYRVVSMDAVPPLQKRTDTFAVKPFRTIVDPLTFAAEKSAVHTVPFTSPKGAIELNRLATPKETVAPFNGLSNAICDLVNGGINLHPSDMALAVGDDPPRVVQAVNDCIAVYDKNGGVKTFTSTPSFFGLDNLPNHLTADPRLIFDWINHRYLFLIISYSAADSELPAFYNLAVSQTDNPAGRWCMYQLNVASGPTLLSDFPRLGQDRQAVYLASNLFAGIGTINQRFVGEEIIALQKTDLYACNTTVRRTDFTGVNSGGAFTLQPANVVSPDDDPKSMFFISSYPGGLNGTNKLNLAAIHDPFGKASYSQVTITGTNTYGVCDFATQKGTNVQLLTIDNRISASPYYVGGLSMRRSMAASIRREIAAPSCIRLSHPLTPTDTS